MAIAAHLEESAKSSGKSREPRRTIRLETLGASASGDTSAVTVHNISASGLLIESDQSLAVGESLAIDLPHAESTAAAVVWASGRLHGCQFSKPVSGAVLSAAELQSAVGQELEPGGHDEAGQRESFGARLQRLRKEQGYPLSRIASELGVSKPTVWAWEQGRARPVKGRIEALANVLGVSGRELLSGQDETGLEDLLTRSREHIADVFGVTAENVRIMIEL